MRETHAELYIQANDYLELFLVQPSQIHLSFVASVFDGKTS